WKRWEVTLVPDKAGVQTWEKAVVVEMKKTPSDADAWPDAIHDALAAAGKEMSRLGEERQRLTNDFAAWLIEILKIDDDSFTGMTYLRGGQASFDQMGWQAIQDLLRRNRRACGVDPTRNDGIVQKRYEDVSSKLTVNRSRFAALEAAIDRIIWQLLGLESD